MTRGVDLLPPGDPPVEAHCAAAPPEGDPAVVGRAHVVDESPAVDDGLASGPADLVEHFGDGLREHDVARGGREREAIAGKRRGSRVDGEHGRPGADSTASGLDAPVRVELRDLRPLVNACAPLEQLRPEAEREPRRVHGRVQAEARAAEEERGVAARTDVVRADGDDFLGCAELAGGADDRSPGVDLRLRRRHTQHRCGAVPRIDLLILAPAADPTNSVLRRAADGERTCVSHALSKRRGVRPERLAEAAVPAARAMSAHLGLEDHDVGVRLEVEEVPGSPEPEVAAADDDHVCAGIAVQRARGNDLAGLLEPPAVARVTHRSGGSRGPAREREGERDQHGGCERDEERPEEREPARGGSDRDEHGRGGRGRRDTPRARRRATPRHRAGSRPRGSCRASSRRPRTSRSRPRRSRSRSAPAPGSARRATRDRTSSRRDLSGLFDRLAAPAGTSYAPGLTSGGEADAEGRRRQRNPLGTSLRRQRRCVGRDVGGPRRLGNTNVRARARTSGGRLRGAACSTAVAAPVASRTWPRVAGREWQESTRRNSSSRSRPSAFLPATFRVGDIEALPWDDDSFELVTGFSAFQFADDKVRALQEARRVARRLIAVVIPTRAIESGIAAVFKPSFRSSRRTHSRA